MSTVEKTAPLEQRQPSTLDVFSTSLGSIMYYAESPKRDEGYNSYILEHVISNVKDVEAAGLALGVAPNILYRTLQYAVPIILEKAGDHSDGGQRKILTGKAQRYQEMLKVFPDMSQRPVSPSPIPMPSG